MRKFRPFLGLLLLCIWGPARALAHDPGLSAANVSLGAKEVTVELRLSPADLAAVPDAGRATRLEGAVEWRVGDRVVAPTRRETREHPGDDAELRFTFPRGEEPAATFHSALLAALPFGHRQLLAVRGPAGEPLDSKLLSAKSDTALIALAAVPNAKPPPTFPGFVALGIEHIFTGYDHLLFLAALLLVCPSFGAAVKILTCFTLAHSLTLALATLGLVEIPSRVVEPLIAASIVYVGLENLVSTATVRRRAVLTLGFGLIHGLGFAGVLRDLGVGTRGAVAGPLVGFNLGVECGQVALAATTFPLLLRLRRSPSFLRRGVPLASIAIACAGAYWLVERTVFAP